MRLAQAAHRRPGLAVALSYLAVGVVALAPSIRPGRTVVATDLLTIVTPYSSLPGASTGHNPLLSDIACPFYPWLSFVGRALHLGHLPQWNPALLGGVAVTPNGYVSPYTPPTWLAAVFSPFVAYNLFVLLHLLLGALGAYAFSRVVGARRAAAWVAGLLGFTAAFWVHWSLHLGHLSSFVWLPWALAAGHRLVQAPSPRRVALLAGVYGLWWIGGNPQYVYDGSAVLVAYLIGLSLALAIRARGRGRPELVAVVVRIGGVAAASPTPETSDHILRTREPDPPNGAVPRSEAIRVLVPDATGSPPDNVLYGSNDEPRMDSPFVGVTGFLLAVAALGGLRGTEPAFRSGTEPAFRSGTEPAFRSGTEPGRLLLFRRPGRGGGAGLQHPAQPPPLRRCPHGLRRRRRRWPGRVRPPRLRPLQALVDDYGPYAHDLSAVPPLADGRLVASPLLDALDVRTVIADPGVTVPSTFPVVDAGVPVVYARPSPGPAVVVPAARPVTLDGAWTAVADPGWDPSATAAVVGLRHPVAGGPGTVTGGPRGTDGERWLVNAPSGGFLRVSGNWDPGWAATIDGHAVPVLRADAIFRGVVVAAGHHRVELSYRNPGEHQGRLVAGAGVVLLLGLLMAGRRRGQAWSPPVRR